MADCGIGSTKTSYWTLPTNTYPTTGNPIEVYGYKYPIEDCQSGECYPGYLWWNGYIPANRINSRDASGKPNGIMGVPSNYKPATVSYCVSIWISSTCSTIRIIRRLLRIMAS